MTETLVRKVPATYSEQSLYLSSYGSDIDNRY